MTENAPERDDDAPADATAGAHVATPEPETPVEDAPAPADDAAAVPADDATDAAETDDGPEDDN